MRIGDGVAGFGIPCDHRCVSCDGIFLYRIFNVLASLFRIQFRKRTRPAVSFVQNKTLSGILSVRQKMNGNAVRPLAVLIVAVVPGLGDRKTGLVRHIAVCDGKSGCGVTVDLCRVPLDRVFRNRIDNFLSIRILGKIVKAPCPAVCGSNLLTRYLFAVRLKADGDAVRPLAVLVILIIPDLTAAYLCRLHLVRNSDRVAAVIDVFVILADRVGNRKVDRLIAQLITDRCLHLYQSIPAVLPQNPAECILISDDLRQTLSVRRKLNRTSRRVRHRSSVTCCIITVQLINSSCQRSMIRRAYFVQLDIGIAAAAAAGRIDVHLLFNRLGISLQRCRIGIGLLVLARYICAVGDLHLRLIRNLHGQSRILILVSDLVRRSDHKRIFQETQVGGQLIRQRQLIGSGQKIIRVRIHHQLVSCAIVILLGRGFGHFFAQ